MPGAGGGVISLAVAVGGAIGSLARFWLGYAIMRWTGPSFPWGTVAINISGSAAIGALAVLGSGPRVAWAPEWRAFAMVGLCGGYTTFSTFSLQTVELVRAGQMRSAVANIGVSVCGCLLATLTGAWVAAR